jgi:hypothetical protein
MIVECRFASLCNTVAIFYEFIYVNSIQLLGTFLVEHADTVDNIGYTPSVFDHFQRSFPSHVRSICFPP